MLHCDLKKYSNWFISLILLAAFCIDAPAFGNETKPINKKNKMKVSIDIYSGRENPSFFLDENDLDAVVIEQKINEAKQNMQHAESLDETSETDIPKLGYRGVIIEKKSKNSNYTEYIFVNKEKMKIIEDNSTTTDFTTQALSKNTGKTYVMNDPNNDVENYIINLAIEKGIVKPGFNKNE